MSSRLCLVLLLVFLPRTGLGQSPSPRDVVVNEVMYAPSPASNEFLELYNRSSEAVQLSRLEYADANSNFSRVSSTDSLLKPDEYVVLVRDSSAFAQAFPSVRFLTPEDWDALNNGGDTVTLRDRSSGTVIDEVPYDPSWGGGDGASLERIDPDGLSTQARNFGSSEAEAGATPSTQNSIFDPDETPPVLDQVRPTPTGDSLLATFSEPLDTSTVTASAFSLGGEDTPDVTSVNTVDTATARVVCTLDRRLPSGSLTLVATEVADPPGNVQPETEASFRFFQPGTLAPGDVIISEILYAPSPPSNEFVEVYNRSENVVDLGTLQYADENRDFDRLAPRFTPLPPDSHAVIVRDPTAFETTFPRTTFQAPEGWDALNNSGDTVILRHAPSATIIDEVPYRASWGATNGRSLERIDPAGPSEAPSNFGTSEASAGATPGARNSLYDPDETPPQPVFAEQRPRQQIAVTFSEPLNASSVTSDAFSLSGTTVTDVTLSRDTVVTLSLANSPSGTTIEVDGVEDRVGNMLPTTAIPVGFRPSEGDVIINEILYDPRADDFDDRPNQVEYVEVFNRTDRTVTVRGLFVTDRPTERGTSDTIQAGERALLPPSTHGIITATTTFPSSPDSSQLAAAFPDAPLARDSVTFLAVDTRRLGLGNDGDRVRLHRADGTVLAGLEYSPDWHAPALEETKGTALERLSTSGPPEAESNWTSSTDPAGGTPGQRNAVSLSPPEDAPSLGLQVEPSPFSVERDGATRIRYALETVPNLVRVRIFDARGRKVRTLEDARLSGRSGELIWKGRDDAGNPVRIGVYVVHFEAVQTEAGTIATFKKPIVVGRPLN